MAAMVIDDASDARFTRGRVRRDPHRSAARQALHHLLTIGLGIGVAGLALCGVLALRFALAVQAWPAGIDLLRHWLPGLL
jgi:hypothetical protein